MQIPLLVIATVLAMAPFLSREIYVEMYRLEKRTIAVDNAAILIGRTDRAMTAFLAKSNLAMRAADLFHDLLHVCAKNPKTAAICVDKDMAMERQLAFVHSRLYDVAKSMWVAGSARARIEMARLGVVGHIDRARLPPIHSKHCPLCWLAITWEADGPMISRVSHGGVGAQVRLEGKPLKGGNRWNYRVLAE